MPSYRAMIEGRNFFMSIEGRARRHGFYQTVFVHGADAAEAGANAVRLVDEDSELKQLAQNSPSDPPMLFLASLVEIEGSQPAPVSKGRTYYVDKQWWQFWL